MNNPRRIQRHLVKALAAGALLAAAALPLAIATAAGATTVTSVAFSPHGTATNTFGEGASGTFTVTGTTFAADGGNVTVTSTAPGATFTETGETATSVTGTFASTSSTTPGTYSLTVTDDSGTSTLASAFTVNAAPTITSIAPATLSDGNGPTTVVLTGTGFTGTPSVSFTSTVNGTTLTATYTSSTATSITYSVTPTNSVTSAAATAGTYNVAVTNGDGGSASLAAGFSITGYGVSNVSPSALPFVTTAAVSTPVTITGAGFEYGATVTLGGTTCIGVASGDDAVSIASATVTSPTTITATITQAIAVGTNTAAECSVTVTNPSVINGGNAATYTLAGALGIGEASTVAPTVTATSATTAIAVGSPASAITFTGSGFSYKTTAAAFLGTGVTAAADTTLTNTGSNTGTSATFNLTVASGATAGPDNVVLTNTAASAAGFPAAFTVAGPAIASQSPAGIAVGAAYGTTITLTGTGFTNTTTGTVTDHAGGAFNGILSYVSPTTMNLVITVSPNTVDATAGDAPTVALSQSTSTGTVVSPAFALTIDADPVVNSAVTYATAPVNDVGVGATAQTITIHGTGFATGATVGSFVNGAGTADPDVTAKVTSVTSTAIVATVAIAAGDTNFADGYSVTNTDGGVAKVTAIAYPLLIGAGPTITSVTPSTGAASATTSFALAGTGFESGVVVTLSPSNGTCGVTTFTSSTTVAVTCTLGLAGVTPTDLVVTNPDGGTATSSPVLPAGAPAAKPFHVSGVHGAAVAGTWVTVQITGTGFYGQPKITSNAAGSKFAVEKDNGSALTVKIYTKPGLKGEHVLTVHLANGKSGKAGYNIKA